MKDIRQLAMWGAVYILQPTWLEECSRQKREVETDLHQVPQNLLLQGTIISPGGHVFLRSVVICYTRHCGGVKFLVCIS